MKKAQGISMNVIIIAAIALLVLVILSVIFMGRMGTWGKNVDDCVNKGGNCNYWDGSNCNGPQGETWVHFPTWSCQGDGDSTSEKKCCVKV